MSKKKDFLWRHQPPLHSDKAKMFAYIQNQDLHPSQDTTAMINAALTAYYMPIALLCEGNHSKEYLELLLLDSANAFASQLGYLCAALNVDSWRIGKVLFKAFPISFEGAQAFDENSTAQEELNNFELTEWNLAGITTDSETF